MNLPEWLQTSVEDLGTDRLAGDLTRQAAIAALARKIIDKDDRPLIDGVLMEFAGRVLDAWHRGHQHAAPAGPLAQVQAELFPDLPPRLYVAPATTKPLMLCTAHDWEMARNVLENRTENAIKGAREDWEQFEAAYDRVRPLLDGELTTADVIDRLTSNGEAAAQ